VIRFVRLTATMFFVGRYWHWICQEPVWTSQKS